MNENWREHSNADEAAGAYLTIITFINVFVALGIVNKEELLEFKTYYWRVLCPL